MRIKNTAWSKKLRLGRLSLLLRVTGYKSSEAEPFYEYLPYSRDWVAADGHPVHYESVSQVPVDGMKMDVYTIPHYRLYQVAVKLGTVQVFYWDFKRRVKEKVVS